MKPQPRYTLFSTTGYLIPAAQGPGLPAVGTYARPVTTWYVFDSAYCRTVAGFNSKWRAKKWAALENERDRAWDAAWAGRNGSA